MHISATLDLARSVGTAATVFQGSSMIGGGFEEFVGNLVTFQ